MDMSEYKDKFIDEAREHLETVTQALLDLEKDPANLNIINIILRSVHTLKSSSSAMEFNLITSITHEIEDVLHVLRTGKVVATRNTVNVLFESIDILEELVRDVAENRASNVDLTDLVSSLNEITRGTGDESENTRDENVNTIENNIDRKCSYELKVYIEKECPMKGIRAFMVLMTIEESSGITALMPSREQIEDGEFDLYFSIVINSSEDPQKIKDQIMLVSDVEKVELILAIKSEAQIEEVEQPLNVKPETQPKDVEKKKKIEVIQVVDSIRVHTKRLDSLMNKVGELVINKIRLVQISEKHNLPELKEAIDQLNNLTTDLQDEVSQIRMVPISHVFNNFPRMIRDLSSSMDKKIELVIEGSNIKLDRTILDEIGKPLVHLLRNCVDHGIELLQDREKLGKNPTGTIRLTAFRDKQTVNITVEDDGKGIDPVKLRNTAIEKGLITEEIARSMSDEETFNLIFTPGFSTAKEVTDVSGRGVGLDVVKTKIASLRGEIKIESTLDVGTRITLKLPISLAIVKALMVNLNEKIYAIPLSNVVETLNVKQDEIKTLNGQMVTVVQNQVLPLLSLADMFGEPNNDSPDLNIVIVEKNEKHTGLIVDSFIRLQEIVIKSFDSTIERMKGFSGATILGDGDVVLIMDVNSIVALNQ